MRCGQPFLLLLVLLLIVVVVVLVVPLDNRLQCNCMSSDSTYPGTL
jgi:hypothetical protein